MTASVSTAGVSIPALGLGTFSLQDEAGARMIRNALNIGYRLIDTAQLYENEAAVGEGIRSSAVPRDQIFITTKVGPRSLAAGRLERSLEESLVRLGVDQIDLALIHWPNPAVPVAEAIGALCHAKRLGYARNIGVSNFTIALLGEALAAAAEPLLVNQIEYHPFVDQTKMLAALRHHGMAIMAYCPIAKGQVVGDPVIEAVAKAHARTAAQVTLRWLVQQRDVIAIPRSSDPRRLRENFAVFDFKLSDDEIARIAGLSRRNLRLVNEPEWVPVWD